MSSDPPSRFQNLLEAEDGREPALELDDGGANDKDCILSQDFFSTPDYITLEGPQIVNNFEFNKENIPCPRSPEKSINGCYC
ncbi:wee1-like protein kinase isoform X2 [Phoenix dactylifera]|nr:wee1-like protein kinase isoform X2 [Phoenix dactylifera]